MTINILIGLGCILIAGLLFLSLLRDILHWLQDRILQSYKDGYERGRRDADVAWIQAEKEVDQARQEIWREESKQ